MTALEKAAFPIIFLVTIVAYGMSLSMTNEDFAFHWMAREDGVLEWLTVFSLGASALLCWRRCWLFRHTAARTFLTCSAFYGAVMVFGVGEEISWGQRIFDIQTPEFLMEANAQKETNLHNLVVGETSINKLVFGKILAIGLVIFLIGVPFVYRRSAEFRRLTERMAIPVPRLQHTLAILAAVLLVETSRASKRGEITEFALTSIVFLLVLNPLNAHIFNALQSSNPLVKEPRIPSEKQTQIPERRAA